MTDSPQSEQGPNHIGIIMDGNGRWAKARGQARIKGHRQGAETCRQIIEACQEMNVHYLTLYAFSAENWNRPKAEVGALMELLEFFISRELKKLKKRQIRLRAIGRMEELPKRTRRSLENAIEETAHFTDWNLTLALNYSSRNEVTDAMRAVATKVQAGELVPNEIDWDTISNNLYTNDLPDPDLIIRTSGETRVSNFLLMQSAYSEYYFTDVYWPDFTKERLSEAIDCYNRRERRFGKTGDQLSVEAKGSPQTIS